MSAKTATLPKWKIWLRRATRTSSFWQQNLEQRLDARGDTVPGQVDLISPLQVAFEKFVEVFSLLIVGGITLAAIAQLIIAPIFLSPGFAQYGLADPIGRGLASVCQATGQCSLPYLLGGSVVAVLIIFLMLLSIAVAVREPAMVGDDNPAASVNELFTMVDVVHDAIVRLRAEMVLNGVLKLTADEQAEVEELEEELAADGQEAAEAR